MLKTGVKPLNKLINLMLKCWLISCNILQVTGVLKRVQTNENSSNYKSKRNKNQIKQGDVQQTFHVVSRFVKTLVDK